MSKHIVKLTLVEMYALKHALQKEVADKKKKLSAELEEPFLTAEEAIKLFKDIEHETELVNKMENEIKEYRSTKKVV